MHNACSFVTQMSVNRLAYRAGISTGQLHLLSISHRAQVTLRVICVETLQLIAQTTEPFQEIIYAISAAALNTARDRLADICPLTNSMAKTRQSRDWCDDRAAGSGDSGRARTRFSPDYSGCRSGFCAWNATAATTAERDTSRQGRRHFATGGDMRRQESTVGGAV